MPSLVDTALDLGNIGAATKNDPPLAPVIPYLHGDSCGK